MPSETVSAAAHAACCSERSDVHYRKNPLGLSLRPPSSIYFILFCWVSDPSTHHTGCFEQGATSPQALQKYFKHIKKRLNQQKVWVKESENSKRNVEWNFLFASLEALKRPTSKDRDRRSVRRRSTAASGSTYCTIRFRRAGIENWAVHTQAPSQSHSSHRVHTRGQKRPLMSQRPQTCVCNFTGLLSK